MSKKARLGIYTLEDLKAFRDAVNNRGDLARWTSIDTETGKDVINLYIDIDLKNGYRSKALMALSMAMGIRYLI